MAEGWRREIDAHDYLLHRQKRQDIESRRPNIRRASDLVGPGINALAVHVDNWNDALATFNGYFSGDDGAAHEPRGGEGVVGFTCSDGYYGGFQTVTGMDTGIVSTRTFQRNPADAETILFDPWHSTPPDIDWQDVALQGAWQHYDTRKAQVARFDGEVVHRGLVQYGSGVMFVNPNGFRPEPRGLDEHHFPVIAQGAYGVASANSNGQVKLLTGSNVWVDLSTIRYRASF